MEYLVILLLAVILVALSFMALATGIILKRKGKFPNTHVGGNAHLKRKGIYCAQTQDRIERAKMKRQIDYKKVEFIELTTVRNKGE